MHRRYALTFIPLEHGELLVKNNLRNNIGRGWARGASQKFWDSLLQPFNFKFGTQLGFGEYLTNKHLLAPKSTGVWARGASKKCWDPPTYLCNL